MLGLMTFTADEVAGLKESSRLEKALLSRVLSVQLVNECEKS